MYFLQKNLEISKSKQKRIFIWFNIRPNVYFLLGMKQSFCLRLSICLRGLKEPPRCGLKSVPKSQFCAHSLRYHRELSSEVFHELALSVCQKYIFKLISKIFETTNDGAHPAGTDISFMKTKLYFSIIEIQIYKLILTFDKKIPQNCFLI